MRKYNTLNLTKRINTLALPILASFLTSFLFTFGDQMIIGRTTVEGYASVTMVSNILYTLTGTLGVVGVCLNLIGSKFLGEEREEQYERLFNTAFTFAILIGVLFEGMVFLFGKEFLQSVLNQPPEMVHPSLQYLYIASFGLGLNLLIFVYSAYYKSVEQPLALVYASLISNAVNLLVDYLLVFGVLGFPKLGVAGAAIGTVLGLLVNLIFYQVHFMSHGVLKQRFMLDWILLKKIFKNYVPLVGQDFLESTAIVLIISAIIARLGTLSSAIYGVCMFIMSIFTLPIYAYGNAVVTLVAKSNGAKDSNSVRRIPPLTTGIMYVILLVIFIPFLIFAKPLIGLITNEKELVVEIGKFLVFLMGLQCINLPNLVYKYALNGIGDEKWVFYFSILITGLTAPLLYYLAVVSELGLRGLFIGLALNYLGHAIGFILRFEYLKKIELTSVLE